jgi:hypothetical protein
VAAVLELAVVTGRSPRILERLLNPGSRAAGSGDGGAAFLRSTSGFSSERIFSSEPPASFRPPAASCAPPAEFILAPASPRHSLPAKPPCRKKAENRTRLGGGAKGLTVINLVRLGRRASVASENCVTHGINEPVALLRPLFAAASVKGGKE